MNVNLSNLPELILALVAVGGLFSGWQLSKRGEKNQREQQQAANFLASRAQAFDEVKEYADRVESENGRLRDDMRDLRAEHSRNLVERARMCQQIQRHQSDIIRTLRDVVTDEVAKASADAVIEESTAHTREHLQELDDDGVIGP